MHGHLPPPSSLVLGQRSLDRDYLAILEFLCYSYWHLPLTDFLLDM